MLGTTKLLLDIYSRAFEAVKPCDKIILLDRTCMYFSSERLVLSYEIPDASLRHGARGRSAGQTFLSEEIN